MSIFDRFRRNPPEGNPRVIRVQATRLPPSSSSPYINFNQARELVDSGAVQCLREMLEKVDAYLRSQSATTDGYRSASYHRLGWAEMTVASIEKLAAAGGDLLYGREGDMLKPLSELTQLVPEDQWITMWKPSGEELIGIKLQYLRFDKIAERFNDLCQLCEELGIKALDMPAAARMIFRLPGTSMGTPTR